ncbi:hypothetical protein FB451DRAFT_1415871 [Mycena latifolia]|nr:hypothetical protein FB451DRAFT_1415871 [Mycena latifolia]
MTDTIQVHFQGLSKTYVAKRWRIPKHEHDSFEHPCPNPYDCCAARTSFIREPPRRQETPRSTWGIDEEYDPNLIYATAKSPDASKRFCLRLVLNAEKTTRDTRSKTFLALSRLMKDANSTPPILTMPPDGLCRFTTGCGVWTRAIGLGRSFSALPRDAWSELSYTKMNTEANRILVGRTFEALHDYGVEHGGLKSTAPFRHAIIDVHAPGVSREDVLNGKAPCYIVGFSEARARHRCMRKVPLSPLDAFLWDADVGCHEITDAFILLKFPESTKTSRQWHDTYSRRYPDLDNWEVLTAQRARLYPEMPPVYHGLDITFESEDQRGNRGGGAQPRRFRESADGIRPFGMGLNKLWLSDLKAHFAV